MTEWTHLVIEGYCLAELPASCGKGGVSLFCLSCGMCPFFRWTESSEREAALYVPLRLILLDKLLAGLQDIWHQVDYQLLHRGLAEEILKSIKTATPEESPGLAVFENWQRKAEEDFPAWFQKAEETLGKRGEM